MSYIIGIDTGLSGAIAVINTDIGLVAIHDTPTTTVKKGKKNKNIYIESAMVDIITSYDIDDMHIGLEVAQSMPGQGVVAMFSTGEGYGLWKGIIAGLRIPITLIRSQAWKKVMMAGMSKEKSASCYRAQQLYPHETFFGLRGGAKDGRGDAALIATYLKQTLNK